MAVTQTSRNFANGTPFGSRFFLNVVNVFSTLVDWNNERVTRATLNRLTDRELDDIGLNRADLNRV